MGKIIYAVLAIRPSCFGLTGPAQLPLPSQPALLLWPCWPCLAAPAQLPWPSSSGLGALAQLLLPSCSGQAAMAIVVISTFQFMGKIYGENKWGKLMMKINGEKIQGKLMVLFSIANLLKNFPISRNQENGNKVYGDFQQYFFP